MLDATYLRAQATWCLEMAWQISDLKIAESLRADAARYYAEATKIEASQRPEAQRAADWKMTSAGLQK